MRKYCDAEKENQSRNFYGFTHFQHLESEKISLGMLSICLSIHMDVLFQSLTVTHQCLVNMNILVPKRQALQIGLKTKKWKLSKKKRL